MKHQIKDIAASQSVPWGTIAERIDENFAENETNIKNKQDIISDLEAIRSGAEKGMTSVQPADISEFLTVDNVAVVATTGRYEDLVDKPTIPSAITESTVSGWGFTKNGGTIVAEEIGTEIEDTTEFATKEYVDNAIIGAINSSY